jgi:hypothetical protein
MNALNDGQGKVVGTSNDRLFYTLPHFLTVETKKQLPPMSVGDKFKVVALGTSDYVEYPWWGVLAAISQATNGSPAFGQDWEAYAKRYGTTAGDSMVENFMVGAVFPSILSQDPRYYQSGQGSFFRRTGYWRLSADVHSVLLRYDPHASVLINPSVTKDAFSPSGFPTRRWTVLSPSLLSRPLEIYSKVSSSWRWESGKRSGPSKRSVFSTAIRLPLAAAAGVDTVCRWTTRPRRVVLGSSAYTQLHLRARNEPRPLMFS